MNNSCLECGGTHFKTISKGKTWQCRKCGHYRGVNAEAFNRLPIPKREKKKVAAKVEAPSASPILRQHPGVCRCGKDLFLKDVRGVKIKYCVFRRWYNLLAHNRPEEYERS